MPTNQRQCQQGRASRRHGVNTLPPGQPELWILVSEQAVQPQDHRLGLAPAGLPVLPGAAGDAEQLGRLTLGVASRLPGGAEI